MSSILDDIENTLQHGDVEMLRKEINERLDVINADLCSKSDVGDTHKLASKIYELEYINKEIYGEFRKIYEKFFAFTILVRTLIDESTNTEIKAELLNNCNDFAQDFYSCEEKLRSYTY